MEQGHQYCWMQTTTTTNDKRKLFYNNPSSHHDDDYSWEEQAFAEDAAGSLGGCIWPPRSYTCSFCRREFRSAQALGGHMNVHRRDRARLKQPSSPNKNNNNEDEEIMNNNPFISSSLVSYNLYPPNVCGFACTHKPKPNPNSDLDLDVVIASSSSSNPLLLAPPSSSSSSIKEPIFNSSSSLWSTLGGDHHHHHHQRLCSDKFYPKTTSERCEFDSHPHLISSDALARRKKFYTGATDLEKVSGGFLDSGCSNNKEDDNNDGGGDVDDQDVALSLNLVVCSAHKPLEFETKEDEDKDHCKRRKIDSCSSSIQFLPKSISSTLSIDHHQDVQQPTKVFELSPSSIEELDLELRLGNKSKSKV